MIAKQSPTNVENCTSRQQLAHHTEEHIETRRCCRAILFTVRANSEIGVYSMFIVTSGGSVKLALTVKRLSNGTLNFTALTQVTVN